MHKNKPGVLISFRGHTLTVDEGHALVYGLLGFIISSSDEVYRTIAKEPHYFLAGLALSFALGRRLRR